MKNLKLSGAVAMRPTEIWKKRKNLMWEEEKEWKGEVEKMK